MKLFEQVALGWQCLWHMRRELPRPELWGPWLMLFLVQTLIILILFFAAHPVFSWFMAPLLRAMAHDDVLRYPELLRRLPAWASQLGVISGLLLGSLAAGAATRQFADRFRGARVRSEVAWSEALPRWGSLLLAAMPVALTGFMVQVSPALLTGVRMSSISRRLLPDVFALVGLVLSATLLYATALVMLERRNGFAALAEVPRTWARGLVPALVVVVLVALLRLPLDRLALASGVIVDRGIPELAVVLALGQAAVAAFTGFLLTGTSTLLYLSVVSTREEDRW